MNHQKLLSFNHHPTLGLGMLVMILLAACNQTELPSQTELPIEHSTQGSSNQTPTSQLPAQPAAVADDKTKPGLVKTEFAANEDWPYFRGDARSTGVARTELPAKLDVLWEHKVKQGAFEGTPAITGGKDKTVYIGDLDGSLFALNLDTGKVLWEYKVEIGFVTAPAVKDDHIYIGDIDGIFYCLDLNGELVWKHQTNAEINSSANFYGPNVLFGSQDTKLYALDKKTGKVAWEHETADQVRCSATVVDNRAFVAGCDGGLHIIDLDAGKEISSVDIQSPTGVTPAVMGNMLFVGTEQAGFFAIDWKTADVKWTFEAEGGATIRSCPAVTKGHVVFGAQDRIIYSLDPETGAENWATTLKSSVDSSPVIVGERVFIAATDGRLYSIELASGEILWEKQLNGGVIGSPAVAFGRLVVATDRGVVYCLGSKEQFPSAKSE